MYLNFLNKEKAIINVQTQVLTIGQKIGNWLILERNGKRWDVDIFTLYVPCTL